MIDSLIQRLSDYSADALPEDHSHRQQAAVLIPVVTESEPMVVLTQRASSLGSHANEVAWPGGKQDPEDASLMTTALRESHEEIGLHPDHVRVVAELRPFVSKFGLLVTPFVGVVERSVELQANPDELDAIFRVPLSYFHGDPRSRTDVISRHGETHKVPAYIYDGFEIWGLTAMILREFLNAGLDSGIR